MAAIVPISQPSASLSSGTSSIRGISNTISGMRKSLSGTKKVVDDAQKVILNRTKIKSDAVFKNKTLFQKRQDAIRKKEAEDQLEASNLSSILAPGFATEKAIISSGKGFLGRILAAIAYLGVGWLLRNLPTWIGMAKEFVARIYRGVEIVKKFFSGTIGFFGSLFSLLGSVAQNALKFDFFDTSNRVKDSFSQLNQNLSNMSSSIDEAIKLMTTSLGEGLASGQNAPPLGTQGESQFPQGEGEVVVGTASGIHKQALDIIASRESTSAGGYNAMNQGTINDPKGQKPYSGTSLNAPGIKKPLTDMTVGEILRRQGRGLTNDQGFIHAAGRYQFIGNTLPGLVQRAGIPLSARFSPAVQDKLALTLIQERGLSPWQADPRHRKYNQQEQAIIEQARRTPFNLSVATSSGSSENTTQMSNQPSTSGGTLISSRGSFIEGNTGDSRGAHYHFGPGPATAKLAQQGDVFPGKFYSDVRDVAFKVGRQFLSQNKSFLLGRSNRWIQPGISDGDFQKALMEEQRAHTRKGSDGGIDMSLGGGTRLPMSVSDVKWRNDGFGISGTIAGTNVFVGHGAEGSASNSNTIAAMPSMDGESLTPTTTPEVINVTDTRDSGVNMADLSALLSAAALQFQSGGQSQIPPQPVSQGTVLNNFIKQKFLTDLAYL